MNSSLGLDPFPEIAARAVLEAAAEAYSGAHFERVVLADGRRLVLKYLPPEGDWLTRFTGGEGRLRLLWESGTLARVATTVDHAVLGIVPSDGGEVVIMRDVADVLLPAGTPVSSRLARRLLGGLGGLHHALASCQVEGLCAPAARYRLFAPTLHRTDDGPHPHPARDAILAGWEAFTDLVPTEVAEAVFAVQQQPGPLTTALLESAPSTLVHGDAKLENLGLEGDRLVAIDWGDLTGLGPAEIEVAWFAIQSGWRIDGTPEDLFAAYDAQASRRLDPRALDLACIGAFAQMGFKLAGRARAPDEPTRARSVRLLAWWVDRVRQALSTWSPS